MAPTPSESSSKSDPSSGASSKEDIDEASGTGSHSTSLNVSAAANETDAFLDKLDLLIESGVSEEGNEQVSQTRLTFHERQEFVSAKAEELRIVTQALAECDEAISKLKANWDKPYRELYRSNELDELQDERDKIAKDQSHHETVLQRYFDSVTASTNKGEKTERVFKLTLATDLETRMAGFRQIQLVDLYCLSRGKELWAILPSIHRIGHDIDPIQCMHWRPEVESMPEALQPFWREQSRAFAKQLLMICTPTQRSTLLGTHEFGTKKVSVKAPEDCGVTIYWVLVQLYHPIDRDRRRELESEISGYGKKFKTGNVLALVKELREKHQEAVDISCRLKWDVVAHPIVQALTDRHARFEVQLEPFLNLPANPDNCGKELGELLTKISTTAKSLAGTTDELGAKSAKQVESPEKKLKELEKQISILQAKMAAGPTGPSSRSYKAQSQGYCEAKGCNRKIEGYNKTKTAHWRVCGTCLLKLRSGEMSSIPLSDGSTFGSRKYAKKVWEEYGLRPYYEKPGSTPKAKSAKGGKGKGGGKGKKGGKGGKSTNKKRAYSAQWAEDGSAEESPNEGYDSTEEEERESKDQWWSEGQGRESPRAKKAKETTPLDDLFY